MSGSSYVLERAWVDGAVVDDVLVEIEGGRFTRVTPASPAERSSRTRLPGLTIPGLANCHSHAFHRALRGRTQRGAGTFWTWREQMYAVAQRLDPDSYYALARATYAEMVAAGITTVGEFHYLHHQPGGVPYDDPNAMGHALIAAAADAGIRITLLDTCYLSSGFGRPVETAQLCYSDRFAELWAVRTSQLCGSDTAVIGAAIHSVRAVPDHQLATVVAAATGRPLHVHLSEQPAENADCRAAYGGRTPTRLLADHGVLGPLTTAVHATHLTDDDIALLGESGTHSCFCPTTERDLGDGIGPSRRLRAAGSPLTLGSDSHAVIDLFEEMRAVELDERLATLSRGHWAAADLLVAATGHRPRQPRLPRRRPDRGRRPRRPRHHRHRLPAHRRHRRRRAHGRLRRERRRRHPRGHRRTTPRPRPGGRRTRPGRRHQPARVTVGLVSSTLITHIGELATMDPERPGAIGAITDAALVIEGRRVAWVGSSSEAPSPGSVDAVVSVGGRTVIPGFVDSHSHLVFAGDRAAEFEARMSGTPYAAGGIRTTVAATRAATDEQLTAHVARLVREMERQGTTTVEIKSGYGLTTRDEARSLAIARQFTDETTFLGAHVVPTGPDGQPGDPAAYVGLVTGAMLDAAAPHARWIDVFCERGAFDEDQARTILAAGAARGLRGRLHANQLGHGPGVRLAAELGLIAVDHCTYLDDADVAALADSGTVATLLPGVEFSTRQPYPDARRLLDAGVTVALASDCNPGSCFTSSLAFCIAIAVREMGMTPAEALRAATAGGAAALGRTDVGRLTLGATADLVVLDAPDHRHLAYRPGVPLVTQVWRAGRLVQGAV